jgi:hypothetical protein
LLRNKIKIKAIGQNAAKKKQKTLKDKSNQRKDVLTKIKKNTNLSKNLHFKKKSNCISRTLVRQSKKKTKNWSSKAHTETQPKNNSQIKKSKNKIQKSVFYFSFCCILQTIQKLCFVRSWYFLVLVVLHPFLVKNNKINKK